MCDMHQRIYPVYNILYTGTVPPYLKGTKKKKLENMISFL